MIGTGVGTRRVFGNHQSLSKHKDGT